MSHGFRNSEIAFENQFDKHDIDFSFVMGPLRPIVAVEYDEDGPCVWLVCSDGSREPVTDVVKKTLERSTSLVHPSVLSKEIAAVEKSDRADDQVEEYTNHDAAFTLPIDRKTRKIVLKKTDPQVFDFGEVCAVVRSNPISCMRKIVPWFVRENEVHLFN